MLLNFKLNLPAVDFLVLKPHLLHLRVELECVDFVIFMVMRAYIRAMEYISALYLSGFCGSFEL